MEGSTPLLKLSSEELFDQQALRTLAHMQFGGADLGECLVTMQRVPPGDMKAWYDAWSATAERVESVAQACERDGHAVSAREAWLRASNYYRTAWLMLFVIFVRELGSTILLYGQGTETISVALVALGDRNFGFVAALAVIQLVLLFAAFALFRLTRTSLVHD